MQTGKDATESLLQEQSDAVGILHIASHGEFNDRQPSASRLLLVGDDRHDGSLTVNEVFSLGVKPRSVILSACETGLGKISSGDEVIGMNRAFFYTGITMGALFGITDYWYLFFPATKKNILSAKFSTAAASYAFFLFNYWWHNFLLIFRQHAIRCSAVRLAV